MTYSLSYESDSLSVTLRQDSTLSDDDDRFDIEAHELLLVELFRVVGVPRPCRLLAVVARTIVDWYGFGPLASGQDLSESEQRFLQAARDHADACEDCDIDRAIASTVADCE